MFRRWLPLLVVCAAIPALARAADPAPLTVDLAHDDPNTELPVSAGVPFFVRINNMAPSLRNTGAYEVTIKLEHIPIPPLDIPEPKPEDKKGIEAKAVDPCAPAQKALVALSTAEDEAKAFEAAVNLRKLLKKCPLVAKEAAPYLAAMTEDVTAPSVTLKPGELLRVTVKRPDGDKTRTWERVFSTGESGKWLQSYGFMFIPNRDDEFFSKPQDDGKTFTITQKDDRHGLDFAPSIFFTWLPASKEGSDCPVLGVTGGLGFDLKAPTVFLGPTLMYRQNLQLVAGVVMHQQRRLRGEFATGQTVKESLDLDQLTDKTYRPNFFIGLALRLGKSPF